MKLTWQFLLLFIFCVSCCTNDSASSLKNQFGMCYRSMGATYGDFILISNYKSNSFKLLDLIKYARTYIDTVKADLSVSSIAFIGQPPCKKVFSPISFRDSFSQMKDYEILAVGFNNDVKNADIKNISVNLLIIPQNKDFENFVTTKSIDSLISINPIIK